jgi:hypothetical protein
MEKLVVAVIVAFAGWILFRRFRSLIKGGGCGCSGCSGCGTSSSCNGCDIRIEPEEDDREKPQG